MSEWLDTEIETIRELAGKGYSAAQVASELPGRSRNSVIGKAHRLDIHFTSQVRGEPKPKRERSPRIVKEPKEPKVTLTERERHDSIMLLFRTEGKKLLLEAGDKECKWPMGGEPLRPMACGDPIYAGSYCGLHHRLAHR